MDNDKHQKHEIQGMPTKSGLRGGENNVSKNLIVQPSFGVDWSNIRGVGAFTSFEPGTVTPKKANRTSDGNNSITA